jgi:hypothetical protein
MLVCSIVKSIECVPQDWVKSINYYELHRESIVNPKYFSEIIDSANITKECVSSISDTLIALNNSDYWSLKMYNSWGKFPAAGFLDGTVTDFGDYDQCLSIEPNQVIGESQYCLIDISLPLPEPMPIHQNIFHKVNVLPDYVNRGRNGVFVKFSEDAAMFYWIHFKLGICTPNKCTQNDVKTIARKSELFKNIKYFNWNIL